MAESLANREGFELYDLEYRKEGTRWVLRITVDKEGGITIDDCQHFSSLLSIHLDAENIIEHRYIFEVSSPGIERPLKKEKHYQRSLGKIAWIGLKTPIQGKTRLKGKICGFEDGFLSFKSDEFGLLRIPYTDISSGKLCFTDL
jgi:ribosome maturation factor RimP